MAIENIKIENFEDFKDVEFNLADNVTVINGGNDKTLMNAFSWGLLGKEIYPAAGKTLNVADVDIKFAENGKEFGLERILKEGNGNITTKGDFKNIYNTLFDDIPRDLEKLFFVEDAEFEDIITPRNIERIITEIDKAKVSSFTGSENIREGLQAAMNDIVGDVLGKFTVFIDSNYNLAIEDKFGDTVEYSYLEDNKIAVLKFGFIAAVHQILNGDIPIFADLAWSEFESKTREAIGEILSKIAVDEQVVVLSDCTGFTQLLNGVGAQYTVEMGDTNKGLSPKVVLN